MLYQVISSDNQPFTVPIEYSSKSEYFKAMEDSSNNVEFSIQELSLIKIPVDYLSPLQAMQVYPVDQFFLHEDRIHQLEISIFKYSCEGFYDNISSIDDQDLVLLLTSLVFKNITCAVLSLSLNRSFDRNHLIKNEPNTEYWPVRRQYQYWRSVRSQYLDHLPINRVIFLDSNFKFDQYVAYLRRCDTIPTTENPYSTLGQAIDYLNFIDRGIIPSIMENRLLRQLKFEDLSNPAMDLLYRKSVCVITQLEPSTQSYRRVLNRFKMLELGQLSLENSYSLDEYPYQILENNDARVIQEFITALGKNRILPFGNRQFKSALSYASPAAVELLGIDHQLMMGITTRLDTFLSLNNHRIVGHNSAQVKIAWYCILNGLDVVDDIDWYLKYICRGRYCDLSDLVDHPDKANLIPCVLYYRCNQKHRTLINCVVELGGRIALRDLDEGMTLSMDTLNFMLFWGYTHNDEDLETVKKLVNLEGQDPLVVERLAELYGIELIMNKTAKVEEVIDCISLYDWMRLKPESITVSTWNSLTIEVDDWRSEKITLTEMIAKVEGLISASLWGDNLSLVNGVINYVRLYLTTPEEDEELEQFRVRMTPVVPEEPIVTIGNLLSNRIRTAMSQVQVHTNADTNQVELLSNSDTLKNLMRDMTNAVSRTNPE